MRAQTETPDQLDAAIDRLLRDREAALTADGGELTETARILREALPRFHPRFSFEEHLSRRLAVLRGPQPRSRAAVAPTPIRPGVVVPSEPATAEAELAAVERRRRGLVAGGAIASGVSLVIPIAGAAIVVWRRSRSSGGVL
jgi:hypothetical protein